MTAHVYKTVDVVGSSSEGITQAIEKAGQSLGRMGWFEVEDIRGMIEGDKVGRYHVSIKIGFRLED